mmetsp:Transcript_46667/g.99846  ORF Transcript_46667/g.99846 Transcript_46667/m.99846 type:complete len:223 (-) Transcript_46667:191-859(-)|eukprot:CAMPEP_0206479538 /NCGR_PEP_ID=MMETSP0324_2-20121206/36736_1 /ASSEMBLY_ACC=CAM_ASM_000836 /TAXON_ID=2866 /ORGANISM="Crypthecodinium cohnii, Strain Seligo" /LENGTH=222 /DNA_ID=CAMNT_0053956109 /DNA_START=238 /DNA_END=906 /DNA_ORIENTATION=+
MAAEERVLLDPNFYEVLGAYPEATPSQIKQAYRKAARRWHPDKVHPADKEIAEKRFKQISEANEVLSDVPLRKLYDLYLRCAEAGYVELTDPEDISGTTVMRVPVTTWHNFREMFGGNQDNFEGTARDARYENDEAAAEEPPISCAEWCMAGAVLFGIILIWSVRSARRHWLRCLPAHLYELHTEYAIPLSWALSPLFMAGTSFKEGVAQMQMILNELFEPE